MRLQSTLTGLILLGFPASGAAQIMVGPTWSYDSGAPGAILGERVADAGDVNGDGYRDALVSQSNGGDGGALLFLGGPEGLGDVPFWGWIGTEVLGSLAGVGDLNDDGFGDIALGFPFTDIGGDVDSGRVSVFFGGPSGPGNAPDWSWNSNFSQNWTGISLAGAGDVNGDGVDDLLVGASRWNAPFSRAGACHLFLGGASLANSPFRTYQGSNANANFGTSVAGLGDVNGDGWMDFGAGAAGADYVDVIYGDPVSLPTTGDARLTGIAQSEFGGSLSTAGDVNRDGYADVLVGAPGEENDEGGTYVFAGGAGGVQSTELWSGEPTGLPDGRWGESVGSAGDLNGDGYGEIWISEPGHESFSGPANAGRVLLLEGTPTGPRWSSTLNSEALWIGEGSTAGERFGHRLASLDADDDGVRELLVAAEGSEEYSLFSEVTTSTPPSWPGGSDLRLWSAVGSGTETNALESKPIVPGDTVRLWVDSQSGALAGLPVITAVEVHLTDLWAGAVPGIFQPELQLNALGEWFYAWVLPALPIDGANLELLSPSNLAFLGRTFRFQSYALDLAAPNGLFHASDALEFKLPIGRIFVDGTNGSDFNLGTTPDQPVETIARALQLVELNGFKGALPDLFVTSGEYDETIVLDRAVSIFGGCDPQTWAQTPGQYTTFLGGSTGASLIGIDAPTTISQVEFRSASGGTFGNNLGALVRDCGDFLTFERCAFRSNLAGNGADGVPLGGLALNGDPGGKGANAVNFESTFTPDGGAGGSGANIGGRGGDGELGLNGYDGLAGAGLCEAPGGLGGAVVPYVGGADGNPGAAGDPGQTGAVGQAVPGALGLFGNVLGQTVSGSGEAGTDGCAGGGGGGGAGFLWINFPPFLAAGAGGGGGGGGGEGGAGGGGGQSGGSSVACALVNSEAVFVSCEFISGTAGRGGNGANGRNGGVGGTAGVGGSGANFDIDFVGIAIAVGVGDGGDGGDGAAGGGGGAGAGGNGGDSICVLEAGNSGADFQGDNQFQTGVAGEPGSGGTSGNSGIQAAGGQAGDVAAVKQI